MLPYGHTHSLYTVGWNHTTRFLCEVTTIKDRLEVLLDQPIYSKVPIPKSPESPLGHEGNNPSHSIASQHYLFGVILPLNLEVPYSQHEVIAIDKICLD